MLFRQRTLDLLNPIRGCNCIVVYKCDIVTGCASCGSIPGETDAWFLDSDQGYITYRQDQMPQFSRSFWR
jgi:hypothetical protein